MKRILILISVLFLAVNYMHSQETELVKDIDSPLRYSYFIDGHTSAIIWGVDLDVIVRIYKHMGFKLIKDKQQYDNWLYTHSEFLEQWNIDDLELYKELLMYRDIESLNPFRGTFMVFQKIQETENKIKMWLYSTE